MVRMRCFLLKRTVLWHLGLFRNGLNYFRKKSHACKLLDDYCRTVPFTTLMRGTLTDTYNRGVTWLLPVFLIYLDLNKNYKLLLCGASEFWLWLFLIKFPAYGSLCVAITNLCCSLIYSFFWVYFSPQAFDKCITWGSLNITVSYFLPFYWGYGY